MRSFGLQTINLLFLWWPGVELNHRHADFQSRAQNRLTCWNHYYLCRLSVQYFCQIWVLKVLIPRDGAA